MEKRVALYARVSTDGQSVENQLRELEAVAVKEGWVIVERFVDKGISGAKGREGRPAFDKLCKGIVRREFDLIAAWSVDRLGRSLQDSKPGADCERTSLWSLIAMKSKPRLRATANWLATVWPSV